VAKESKDQQIKQYSAWTISFLREKWSKELQNINSESAQSQSFAEDSLVSKLCLWLRDIDVNKVNYHVTFSFMCISLCDVMFVLFNACMHNCLHVCAHVHVRGCVQICECQPRNQICLGLAIVFYLALSMFSGD